MDSLLAWTEWSERVSLALSTAATVLLLVGELCLALDLIGRVLGTYVRTPARVVARICLIGLACVALAAPYLLAMTEGGGWTRPGLVVSILLSLAEIVNFLFPYQFGIRRIGKRPAIEDDETLLPGVVLRRTSVGAKLPEGSPAAVHCLALADLHCRTQARLQRLQDSLAALGDRHYDLVLALGDLGEDAGLLPQVMESIAAVRPRYGVYAVRGNHDFEGHRGELFAKLAQENSIVVLSNAAHVVPELGIELVGLEYPWNRKGMPERSTEGFALGLTHTPDNIRALSRLGVPFALAGHTHGGKISLPWIGSFPLGSKYGRFLDEGWFELGDTRLYITPGFGHRRTAFGKRGVLVELTLTDRRDRQERPRNQRDR